MITSSNFTLFIDEDAIEAGTLNLSASDIDGDALTFLSQMGTNGNASVDSGDSTDSATVSYLHNADFNGSDSFGVPLSDGTETIRKLFQSLSMPLMIYPLLQEKIL